MSRYTPYGVQIVPDGGSSVTIGGVTEQSIDTGVEVNAEVTAGTVSPQYGEISAAQSGGRFTSHDISSVLSAIGLEGVCLAGAAAPGFAVWSLKREPCGSLASGSVHRKMVIPNGRIVPVSLSVQQGRRAALVCQVQSLYDGTNEPLLVMTAQAAPSGMTDANGFHLGAIQVAGVSLEHVTSLEMTFGNEITPQNEDGEIFAKGLHIASYKPTITISTNDPSKFGSGSIPLTGLLGTHANSSMILRKRSIGTGAFASGANHIKFTAGGVVTYKEFSASSNSPWTASVMVTALDDNTNAMIVPDYAFSLAP